MFKDAIAAHARRAPDAEAIITPTQTVSYAVLDRSIDALCRRFETLEAPPDAVIGVWIREPVTYWAAVVALDRLGLVNFTFFEAPLDIQAARVVRPWRVLTDRAERPPGDHFVFVPPDWLDEDAPAAPPRRRSPDDPTRVLLSSGTTGRPKQIVRSTRMLWERAQELADNDLPSAARALCLFRPYTGLGSTVPLAAFIKGAAVLSNERLNWDPGLWTLRPNFIALPPVLLRNLLLTLPDRHRPDPGLKVVVGGALTPRQLQRATLERLTPNLSVRYGASEVGMVAQSAAVS